MDNTAMCQRIEIPQRELLDVQGPTQMRWVVWQDRRLKKGRIISGMRLGGRNKADSSLGFVFYSQHCFEACYCMEYEWRRSSAGMYNSGASEARDTKNWSFGIFQPLPFILQ